MLKRTFLLISLFFVQCCLIAQEYQPITVRAGTNLRDYFPASQRYLYPDFTQGTVLFKNHMINPCLFNYNVLTNEIEFIRSKDTLIFFTKKEIDLIAVARDTFYYKDGYLQLILSGPLRVYLKRSMVIKNILKQGAMGTVNRSAASEAYDFVITSKISIDLKPVDDMVLQRKDEYFFSTSGNEYIPFTKKNILRALPLKGGDIRKFLNTNKIDFESQNDLLRLADLVSTLLSQNHEKK